MNKLLVVHYIVVIDFERHKDLERRMYLEQLKSTNSVFQFKSKDLLQNTWANKCLFYVISRHNEQIVLLY